jgi:hypothetical protein
MKKLKDSKFAIWYRDHFRLIMALATVLFFIVAFVMACSL